MMQPEDNDAVIRPLFSGLIVLRDAAYKRWPDFPRGLSYRDWRLELNKRLGVDIENMAVPDYLAAVRKVWPYDQQ